MVWAIVTFSFLVGFFGQWLFSVALIFYFSLSAAVAIAALEFYFSRGPVAAGLAALATIIAVQLGFVVSVAFATGMRMVAASGHNNGKAPKPDKNIAPGTPARKRDASPGN